MHCVVCYGPENDCCCFKKRGEIAAAKPLIVGIDPARGNSKTVIIVRKRGVLQLLQVIENKQPCATT